MVSTGPRIYPEMAPDGLWTTPSDLARYVIEVQGSLAGKKGSLLSTSTAHAMLTAQLNPYGLGAIVGAANTPFDHEYRGPAVLVLRRGRWTGGLVIMG